MTDIKDEMQRMKQEYDFVNERFTNLKEKYDSL